MSDTTITALIAIITSGSLTGLFTLLINYKINRDKAKNEQIYNDGKRKDEEMNNQVAAWKEISTNLKRDFEEYKLYSTEKEKQFELQLAMNDRDILRLQNYILSLRQSLIDSGVKIDKLPEMPTLERDKTIKN